mgnify:CR=1 FL=1
MQFAIWFCRNIGECADVQAGKQIKTETKQTINNTKTKEEKFPNESEHQVRQGGMRKIKQGKERRLILLNQK